MRMGTVGGTGVEELALPLERDGFMRTLIQHLAGTLEDVIGVEEAAGYISLVGQHMGAEINSLYLGAMGLNRLPASQVAKVLVDLKKRIKGDFFVIEETSERLVLGNRQCPFGDKVIGRPSMCMMTSNVFGFISASSLGYSKVELQETIAEGASGCRVVVHLDPSKSADAPGREYFGD